MQQRRLRLGDILDDYCPRERRITNHAVVAMIEDDVRLTRCTTCDTEHDYKQGKAPTLRRKKDSTAAAYKEVLAEVTGDLPAIVPRPERTERPVQAVQPQLPLRAAETPASSEAEGRDLAAASRAEDVSGGTLDESQPTEAEQEAARVHRRLIRATLPRIESQVTPRPIPQFTMRQPTGRPGKFRGAPGRSGGPRHAQGRAGGNGNVASRSPFPRGGGSGGGRPSGGHGQPRRGKKR
jgi:hypothetical protein